MTTVTLLIFSGRPDPSWQLTAEEVRELASRLEGVHSAPEVSTLGYRGFLVQSDDYAIPPKIVIRDFPEVERFLLRTGLRRLSPEIIRLASDAIK